jgi:prepilin-type N-terminal cleavage/methylation domain-containing protein
MRNCIPPNLALPHKGRGKKVRRGFTLVELLVVIAIMVALMAMIALAAPRFAERQGPSRGAMQLQSWLNLSRQMAIRDQRPRGLRMLPPVGLQYMDNDKNYCRELVYIEQPDDFYPAPIGGTAELYFPAKVGGQPMPFNYTGSAAPDYTWGVIAVIDPYSTTPPNTIPVLPPDPNATVRVGDILNIHGSGEGVQFTVAGADPGPAPRRIVRIEDGGIGADPSGKPAHLYFVQIDRPVVHNSTAPNWLKPHTGQYVIYRQPRPMAGEPVLQMPRDVGIDFSRELHPNEKNNSAAPANWTGFNWYRFYPPVPTGGGSAMEILFHPNGSVMGYFGTNYARICLWVRDVSTHVTDGRQLPPGDNSLITVYTRTGMVASHPIDPSGLIPNTKDNKTLWNPFRFTQDSLLSGQ